MKKGDYRASLDAVDRYLAIDPRTRRRRTSGWSFGPGGASRQPRPRRPRWPGLNGDVTGLSAQALVEKAKYYSDRQDWFSAHYYAQAASALDPRRTDALRLAAQAAEKLSAIQRVGKGRQERACCSDRKRTRTIC